MKPPTGPSLERPWPPTFTPWPVSARDLLEAQARLVTERPAQWSGPTGATVVAGCFVCFERGRSGPGTSGDRGWAGACLVDPTGRTTTRIFVGRAGASYEPGFLALREGALLESAVRLLPRRPDLLLVDATGRDHPRRAGLASHLGQRLGVPTVGVTDRPLVATGDPPDDRRGAVEPLRIGVEVVAYRVVTRRGTRPVVAHAAWRTGPEQAAAVVLALTTRWRTPEPLRLARQAAREARAGS